MTTPPKGETTSQPKNNSPHQLPTPHPPAKPTKKPRHKKKAEQKSRPSPDSSPPVVPPNAARPVDQSPSILLHRAPTLQPYPGPPYHIMNHPSYPINGSPYAQPAPSHPGYATHLPPAPMNGGTGPGIPGRPPQYAYPMHHTPYPPHSYASYNPYPQQMMVYPHPRPSAASETSQSASSPVSPPPPSATGKRKRKPDGVRVKGAEHEDEDTGPSGGDMAGAQPSPLPNTAQLQSQAQAQAAIDMKKRTKTQRACDSCRSRKIRCDILADTEPPACQHCKQYGFECTFFLPITETRFKKKKAEDDTTDKDKSDIAAMASPPKSDAQTKGDVGVFGPTSAAHLLHSQANLSSRVYESYDLRYHHTWEVSEAGDGLIQVQKPKGDEQQLTKTKPIDLHIERDVVEKLVNAYFTDIAPILPVITQAEFISSPSPILLYSMCLVAAARREAPPGVFESIRYAVNTVIKAEDVLSTASITNLQALLILCMMGDCHSQFVPTALSALWLRLGTAIRMAQDLGLHRAEIVKQNNIEMCRRLWGACVISDRWTAIAYGQPHMIDVHDCDVRLPSSGDPNDLYMNELMRLSVILGRVVKTIFSPSGLSHATDEMLHELLTDMKSWKHNLPDNLQFRGPDTPRNAGLLHLLYSSVMMLFWRVFMRISYTCPAHLKFSLNVEEWSGLVELTGGAIDWLDKHEGVYDVWLLVAYCAASCAFVQYHTWARRQDTEAASKLRQLRDCVRRWEGSISPDHMSARRKTAEIIALLYEATQGPALPIDAPPALNPTGGVVGRPPVGGLSYKKDPSRPGGGVFIAHGDTGKEELKDVPEGVIISSSDQSDESQSEESASASAVPAASITTCSAPSMADGNFMLSSSAFPPPDGNSGMRRGMMENLARREAAGASGSGTPIPMVNFTPLGGGPSGENIPNVNPAMNSSTGTGSVQVLNVLDVPQASNTLEQFGTADIGFLEGIPGGMFDWGQWDTFFSRFNANSGESGGAGLGLSTSLSISSTALQGGQNPAQPQYG